MKTALSLIFLAVTFSGFAQQNGSSPVLLQIDDIEITKAEFEGIYKKNNRDSAITKADLDEYIELFINFKLKVMEAEEMGRDTLSNFESELAGYREQLARPYLVDKSITDSLVREAYDRMQTEIRASHILIKLPPDPSPADTLAAYKKIMELKRQVLAKPQDFGPLAKAQSEDPSAATNEGDLGYFTSLQMVYPFESYVFNTPVGEIGGPVRTRFGYHIVKPADKRPARGQLKVAHIMVRTEASDPEEVQSNNERRIREVYERLLNGEDFAELATKYSDDRSSASRGGELPVFGTGKMVSEFEEVAFGLSEADSLSEPFTSPYGWHIVKLLEKISVQSYDEMEKDLRNRISRDSRSDIPKNIFVTKRKLEYNFIEDVGALKPFYKDLDTAYFSGNWKPNEKLESSDKVLFSLDGKKYTQANFVAYLKATMRPGRSSSDVSNLVDDSFQNFVSKTIMEYEDSKLEEKHAEFKALLKEYRDGILLFDLTDEKVWTKAVTDSAGLAQFYENNKGQFMWKERAGFDIYTVEDEATAKKVVKMLKKKQTQDDIRAALNEESALKVRVESGLKEKADVPVLEQVSWESGVYGPIESEGQMKVVHVKEIRSAQSKGFDEARGLIAAAYQTHLEQAWIKELREKHTLKVNKEVLYEIQ
jgi:peptidyl-prolyl cis-trans isomerase SurA